MQTSEQKKLHIYQLTVLFSVVFALLGFSYNVWRMEVTEENSNKRTACFEMLLALSSLEQLVYAAHYDGDEKEGDPRKGWIKVGMVSDLSILTTENVKKQTALLKVVWSEQWSTMVESRSSTDKIVSAIDLTRSEIKQVLNSLQ